MTVIFLRTLLFYFSLLLTMRLMGKRQIGELQLAEFVSAFMISELASLPITDRDIPFFHGLIAIITIGSLEVLTSQLCKKLPSLRKALYGEPIILMAKGVFLEKGLAKSRITVDEVVSAVRNQGYKSIDDVYYVILEQTGKISIIPKASKSPQTPDDTDISVTENGIDLPIITDGRVIKENAMFAKISEGDIKGILKKTGTRKKDCTLLTADDNGKLKIYEKGRKK